MVESLTESFFWKCHRIQQNQLPYERHTPQCHKDLFIVLGMLHKMACLKLLNYFLGGTLVNCRF